MNVLRALSTVSGMTLLSRIAGLAREILMANYFGAGVMADAFNVAFRAPNLLRRIFAEGAFSQAFVPVFGEYKNQRGEAETQALLARTATLLGLVVGIIAAIGMLAAPAIVYVLASGFSQIEGKAELATRLTQIMFPYIALISLTSVFAGALNAFGKFSAAAFSPVLLNVCMIASILISKKVSDPPILACAWGVAVGGIAQLVCVAWAAYRANLLVKPSFQPSDPGVQRILKLMVPALLGTSVAQVSLLINTQIASYQGTGAVSWLSYADRLMEFPTAMLGVALGTIILPLLIKSYAQKNAEEYSALLEWGLRLTLLLAAPAALALGLIAVPLIGTLLMHGAFTANDVTESARALSAYGVGLVGLIAIKILAPAYFARQEMRAPVRVAVVALLATQGLNLIFVPYLHHAGLALAIGLGAWINAGGLFLGLLRRRVLQLSSGWGVFFARLLAALAILALVLLGFQELLHPEWTSGSRLTRSIYLGLLIAAGGCAYFATLWATGIRLRDFRRTA